MKLGWGKEEACTGFLVGKREEMRPLGRPRRKLENNIRMDLQEAGCGVWDGLSWLRIETVDGNL
jgi:hypothetical protein